MMVQQKGLQNSKNIIMPTDLALEINAFINARIVFIVI